MDLKNSTVRGGVLVVHRLHDGKHQYEVERVMKHRVPNREKMFVRKGDKLMQINDRELQDTPPEDLALMLAEGNPMLRVHKASSTKKKQPPPPPPPPDGDTLHPVSKEYKLLRFKMEMTHEDQSSNEGGNPEEFGGFQEDFCPPESSPNGDKRDMLIVSMTKTSISVVTGRGCDPGAPCRGCQGSGCTFNDVVMMSETSTVKLVSRGGGSFKQAAILTAAIEHVPSHQYLRGLCSEKTLYTSPNPEKITIYHYKSNVTEATFRGIPVVLNFTDSSCFLRCNREGPRVILEVETCEKQTLKQISINDETKLPFVFYMKSDRSKQTSFESVLHRGWFIKVADAESVSVQTREEEEEHAFLFIIRKESVTVSSA